MRNLIVIILTVMVVSVISCSRSDSHHRRVIDAAESIFSTHPDSALAILNQIDPTELITDSLRARYHYLMAYGHMKQNRSMIADSLTPFVHEFYKGKDVVKDMRSGIILAWYKFWVGDTPGALGLLDSLAGLNDVPDSLMQQVLRVRVLLGAAEYQGKELIPLSKRLARLETDTMRAMEAKYMLLSAYEYAQEGDSALALTDELIDYARQHRWGDKHFYFAVEKAQILTELGRYRESDELIDDIFAQSSANNGAADLLHLLHGINALNAGNHRLAARELAVADSFATKLRAEDDSYYRSYSNLLHTMIEFKQTGRMRLAHVNRLNNRQQERFNRMKASQWESERGALQQQSRALALKAESEHKTVVILITGIVALLLLAGCVWIIKMRRHRERENEERIEALQKMVDEFKSAPSQAETTDRQALRRAMLQQLGIIKMVAETPTQQNREMLRKISSIDGDANGELVNWANVHEVIDNLYGGFYSKLHARYGDVLNVREEQIIVLMMAGFSTKEVSVITGQTAATIYVRKSSIRKKLGAAEKEDIVGFLSDEFAR